MKEEDGGMRRKKKGDWHMSLTDARVPEKERLVDDDGTFCI